jgi:hypothetical protein
MHPFVHSVAILVLLTACTSSPTNRLDPVSFHCAKTCFDGGDEIEIESVSARDGAFHPGSDIEVRGHYHLRSRQRARLCLGLTGGDVEGDSWREVGRGAGEFDLTARVITSGAPHMALYSYDTAYNCLGNCAIVVDHPQR